MAGRCTDSCRAHLRLALLHVCAAAGHILEEDYVRMTQEIVRQSLPDDAVPAGWERSVRETREVKP